MVDRRFAFRPLERRDLEWARELHNDESTLSQLTDPEIITASQQEQWFASLDVSRTSKRFVVTASRETSIGPVSINVGIFRADAIDHKNRSVMVGLDIERKWRGHGFSIPIYEMLLSYYFDTCGMNRVYLKVLETNERAIHIYRKLGFVEEGRDRQAVFRGGAFRDYICMSILRDEYVARRDPNRNSAGE